LSSTVVNLNVDMNNLKDAMDDYNKSIELNLNNDHALSSDNSLLSDLICETCHTPIRQKNIDNCICDRCYEICCNSCQRTCSQPSTAENNFKTKKTNVKKTQKKTNVKTQKKTKA